MTDTGPYDAELVSAPGPVGPLGAAGARPAGVPDNSRLSADLSAKAADTIDLVVDTVHDKAVRPLILAARGLVFGLLAAVLSVLVLVMVSVALIRFLTIYVFDGRVWASYALVGLVFVSGGAFLWARGAARAARIQESR
jgi:hypothetical protein